MVLSTSKPLTFGSDAYRRRVGIKYFARLRVEVAAMENARLMGRKYYFEGNPELWGCSPFAIWPPSSLGLTVLALSWGR